MKTVTLETARRLKEAGIPQETAFYWQPPEWMKNKSFNEPTGEDTDWEYVVLYWWGGWKSNVLFAAYTAGELMEWFDQNIIGKMVCDGGDIVHVGVATIGGLYVAESTASGLGAFIEGETHPDNPAEALGRLAIQILESQTTEAT